MTTGCVECDAKVCSRCGGTDAPRPLPKKFACHSCGPRLLCYACDVTHGTWCRNKPT